MSGLDLPMTEVAYNTRPMDYSDTAKKSGFTQQFCMRFSVDIEELMWKWQNDSDLIKTLYDRLTFEEYALINMIVGQGLMDILGQQPMEDEPIEDDPHSRPIIGTPNLNPDNSKDEDPYARPAGWDPSKGIFYDEETGNLVDAEGNIVKEAKDKSEHPWWPMWVKYWLMKYPDNIDIPPVVEDSDDPEFEDFVNWMTEQYGDAGIGGLETPMLQI